MNEKTITCIICPSSCHITVRGSGNSIESIEGHTCKRGMKYASSEYLHPERNLTAIVKAKDYKTPVISVRTSRPVPKDKQIACMRIIRELEVGPPYEIGRVILKNILDTGADILLTNE
ncbi:MAG: DUF1667 domain-containing protein [Firmicutes bacterium]|nr:DUF1667 domain-containing protein [Bacillota bacterium]